MNTGTRDLSELSDLMLTSHSSYVLLTATATTALSFWHGAFIGRYRRAAKVAFPGSFVPGVDAQSNKEAYLFNCAQRAHGNFDEYHPSMLVSMLIGGLQYPLVAAGLGVAWSIARIMYAIGYVNPDKVKGEGRYLGIWFFFPQMGLMGLSAWSAYKMLGI